MKKLLLFLLSLYAFMLSAQSPTANEILAEVDKNMISTTAITTTRMVVHGRRASRTVGSINYSEGNSKFFSEYTSPPREKGTKMLNARDLIPKFINICRAVLLSRLMIVLNKTINTTMGMKPRIRAKAVPGREDDISGLSDLYVAAKLFKADSSFFTTGVCLPHSTHQIS